MAMAPQGGCGGGGRWVAAAVRRTASGARRLLLGRRGRGVGGGGRGVAGLLALIEALLELCLRRAEAPGQLGDGRPAEEKYGDDDDRPDCIETENVSQHDVLLHLSPEAVNCFPR